ncbi:MAG: hypothetical protein E7287_08735 [Lachnospiraceae bacterium]|nr:hypothetical protein [Lachnospiraceae bacterium]
MCIVAAVILAVYGVGFFLSRKEVTERKGEKLLTPFYRLALFLFKKRCAWKKEYICKGQVKRDLELLYPGESKEHLYTAYHVKKTGVSLLICFVGTFLGLMVSLKSAMQIVLTDEGTIVRTGFREGSQGVHLKTELEGEQGFDIMIAPVYMSDEELVIVKNAFNLELEQLIRMDNLSLRQVSSDLNLADYFSGYPFTVEWVSDRPDVLSSTGKVWEVSEKQDVSLKAVITYGSKSWEELIEVCVVPPGVSKEEKLHRELQELLLASEENSRQEKVWKLPEVYGDTELLWKQTVEDYGLLLWGLAIAAAVAVYILSDKDLHSLLLKRRASMKREYPDVVHTLVLYLGAGMTIRGALQRMSCDREGKKRTPVYEEIAYTCRELYAGVSEGLAYEHLGKRTGLQEYVRLCTLLTQNLKKGNAALLTRLKEEAGKASAERMQTVKKLGEEAGTKLLVPMVMMLGAVMLMIMIPAFSAMGV